MIAHESWIVFSRGYLLVQLCQKVSPVKRKAGSASKRSREEILTSLFHYGKGSEYV